MMKDSERVAEVHRPVCERDSVDARKMKFAIRKRAEVPGGDLQGGGAGVDAVQPPDSRRDELCPPPTSATQIKSFRVGTERVPRKNREVEIEVTAKFSFGHRALIESRPFVAETLHRRFVEIRDGFLVRRR